MNTPQEQMNELAGMIREKRKQAEATNATKELKKLKKDAMQFTSEIYRFMNWLDAEMKKPSDQERGKRIAQALNAIEMSADRFSHFTLDQSFEQITKVKGRK